MLLDSSRQFDTEVFPAELAEIRRRRGSLGLPPPAAGATPSAAQGLVGLALSGGGIRSAAFSLGILQALSRAGALAHVDYLSTVSGGSLIGSSVSALLDRPETSAGNGSFPLGFEPGQPDRPAVRYLRNHSSWIAPAGFLDVVRIPTIVLRGIVDNLALLAPLLILAVQLTEIVYGLFYGSGPWFVHAVSVAAAALFLTAVLLQPVFYRLFVDFFRSWNGRNRYELFLTVSLLAAVAVLVLIPSLLIIGQAIDLTWPEVTSYLDRHKTGIWLSIGAAVVLVSLAARAAQNSAKLSGKIALLGIGLLGPGIVFGLYLFLTLYHVDPPLLGSLQLWDGQGEWVFLGIGAAGLLYGFLFAKQNVTSAHGFFRDRMTRAFLFSVDPRGCVHLQDDLKLSDLNRSGTRAPYHLVNTTLNLEGDSHLDLAGRKADFFLLSRHFCGGPTTGYCRTEELERFDRHMNLGTAMAISGAGLAPNMGTATIRPLVFLLALLDLRLDYWCANPARVRETSRLRRLRLLGSVGPLYLLKEALGLLDARGPFVNLSDGGHLENLGVYELLRRRCKWIFAIDADEDPGMAFGCFMDLLRYARIDLGIDIQIDLDPLRLQASVWSAAHFVTGTIDYGGGERGHLVYLKASMTGDEPETIRDYRSRNPAFPQESSANQFFTESQFEAYRALGEHAASAMLAGDESLPWRAEHAVRAAAASSSR